MNLSDIDLTKFDSIALDTLVTLVNAEKQRRNFMANAQATIANITEANLASQGLAQGSDWRQPVSIIDAYPAGFRVKYNGRTWVNLVNGNVYAPGVSGWRMQADGDTPADFVQPSGSHDAYKVGDLVMFDGFQYQSVIEANVWSPLANPSGWQQMTFPSDTEEPENPEEPTDPEEPTEPEEPVEPEVPDFVQPTGGSDAYSTGDRVKFNGIVYESVINNNVWSPSDYPSGWTEVTL